MALRRPVFAPSVLTLYSLWRQHRRVFWHSNGLASFSQFGNGCGRLWRKRKFPLHHVPYVFNWREIWGYCWPEQYTTKSTWRRSSRICGRAILLKKHITFLSRNGSSMGFNNLCIVAGTVYFTLQKRLMWLRVVIDSPPHHEAWGGACVSWANALWKMTLTRSTP